MTHARGKLRIAIHPTLQGTRVITVPPSMLFNVENAAADECSEVRRVHYRFTNIKGPCSDSSLI